MRGGLSFTRCPSLPKSSHLTDSDQIFLQHFHNRGSHQPANFSHREHVRLAWEVMRGRNLEEGSRVITRLISGIAQGAGNPLRYHETLTLFWGRIVHHSIGASPDIASFDGFLEH